MVIMQNNISPAPGLLCECVCWVGRLGGMSRLNYSPESGERLEIWPIFDFLNVSITQSSLR